MEKLIFLLVILVFASIAIAFLAVSMTHVSGHKRKRWTPKRLYINGQLNILGKNLYAVWNRWMFLIHFATGRKKHHRKQRSKSAEWLEAFSYYPSGMMP